MKSSSLSFLIGLITAGLLAAPAARARAAAAATPAANQAAARAAETPAGARKLVSDPAGVNEADRLMQVFMAKRAEWQALRRAAQADAKKAPNETIRKQVLDKLAADEAPLMAETGRLAQQYREAEKKRRPAPTATAATPGKG